MVSHTTHSWSTSLVSETCSVPSSMTRVFRRVCLVKALTAPKEIFKRGLPRVLVGRHDGRLTRGEAKRGRDSHSMGTCPFRYFYVPSIHASQRPAGNNGRINSPRCIPHGLVCCSSCWLGTRRQVMKTTRHTHHLLSILSHRFAVDLLLNSACI